MKDLREYQGNPNRIVGQAKMIYSSSGKQTIVVEGDTDLRLYRQWLVSKNARLEQANGKKNVKEVWLKAKELKFANLHCLVDLDYDLELSDSPIIDSQFIYVSIANSESGLEVECNDLESALIRSHALIKVMSQKYRLDDLKNNFELKIEGLREKLRIAGAKIGSVRVVNQKIWNQTGYAPIGANFQIDEFFFDSINIELNIDYLSEFLLRGSKGYDVENLINSANKLLDKNTNGWQLCRGHDLSVMLGMHLSNLIGRRVSQREIEEDLRLACELEIIGATRFGSKLLKIGSASGKPILGVNNLT